MGRGGMGKLTVGGGARSTRRHTALGLLSSLIIWRLEINAPRRGFQSNRAAVARLR